MSKYCINCQHYQEYGSMCRRPDQISLVTGEMVIRNLSASLERSFNMTGCGEKGIYHIAIEGVETQ
jgi:hypothetical protein